MQPPTSRLPPLGPAIGEPAHGNESKAAMEPVPSQRSLRGLVLLGGRVGVFVLSCGRARVPQLRAMRVVSDRRIVEWTIVIWVRKACL